LPVSVSWGRRCSDTASSSVARWQTQLPSESSEKS